MAGASQGGGVGAPEGGRTSASGAGWGRATTRAGTPAQPPDGPYSKVDGRPARRPLAGRPSSRPSEELIDVPTDPAVADVLREVIRQDAVRTDQPERAELAREALAGRVKVSDVPCYVAYAKILSTGLDGYVEWRDDLSEAERAKHAQSAFDYVASVRTEATLILPPKFQHRPDERAESA
ncbi:hypothetical protein ABN034_31600 [Actinopolymorpha sp. B11F2]|uniref:hypothetical protein n=1 Tax=Actinopolymorpha sp. B11F2 TaxID=3160862 RepID=UPI0032E3A13B